MVFSFTSEVYNFQAAVKGDKISDLHRNAAAVQSV